MSRILRIAAAQSGPIQKADSRQSVVRRMTDLLDQANEQKCDLVVFTELALTTFFPRWYITDQAEVDRGSSARCPMPPPVRCSNARPRTRSESRSATRSSHRTATASIHRSWPTATARSVTYSQGKQNQRDGLPLFGWNRRFRRKIARPWRRPRAGMVMARSRSIETALKWGRGGYMPSPPPKYTPMINRVAPWVWLAVIATIFWLSFLKSGGSDIMLAEDKPAVGRSFRKRRMPAPSSARSTAGARRAG